MDIEAKCQNIIVPNSEVQIEQGKTLDEQLAIDEKRAKLQREIDKLEKLARAEKQPKKKFELAQRKKALDDQLMELK